MCRQAAARLMPAPTTTIHRDYYADQVLVDGPRLYLLDFDLYCRGHAAIDVGNAAAHLIEQRIRHGEPNGALHATMNTMIRRYVELAGDSDSLAIQTLCALSLARHVHISANMPERLAFTEAILDQSEQRMAELL
jgi:Ser/Thr protein kinase RdoA (MazF antagonist)